jgi:hypothetical protein
MANPQGKFAFMISHKGLASHLVLFTGFCIVEDPSEKPFFKAIGG